MENVDKIKEKMKEYREKDSNKVKEQKRFLKIKFNLEQEIFLCLK